MNEGLGYYPEISSVNFNNEINLKKEFDENKPGSKKDYQCLLSHQQLLSNFINPLTQYNSLLVWHQVGLGKTRTAIAIAENFKKEFKILVLTKNELLENNFRNEIIYGCTEFLPKEYSDLKQIEKEKVLEKVKKNISKYYTFLTFSGFSTRTNSSTDSISKLNNTVLIIDEVHSIPDETYDSLLKVIRVSKGIKIVLLSATVMFDNIKKIFEISNLLNCNSNDPLLPIRKDLLKESYIYLKEDKQKGLLKDDIYFITVLGRKKLLESLKGKCSYLIADNSFFANKIYMGSPISKNQGSLNIVRCKMSDFQKKVYKNTLETTSSGLFKDSLSASTIVFPDKTFGSNGFISNSRDFTFLRKETLQKYSCKLAAILQNIGKTPGNIFIYSGLVSSAGTELLRETLLQNNYSNYSSSSVKPKFVVLNNIKSNTRRDFILKKFNSVENKNGDIIKIIIGSPMVSEGITLKNIRQIHILEGHWNMSRNDQVIGRGVRYQSHFDLPKNDRNVEIFMYASVSDSESESIDYLKYKMSEKKDQAIKEIEYYIKKTAVDCYLNKIQNDSPYFKDYSRDCLYNKCNYECPGTPKEGHTVSNSTWQLNYHGVSQRKAIEKKIKELFTIGFVYDVRYIVDFVKTFDKTIPSSSVYIVLDKIIENKDILINPVYKESILIQVSGYYIINPLDTQLSSEFFYKIFDKKIELKNFKKIFGIERKLAPKKKSLDIKRIPNALIYGSFFNKLGKLDGIFRVVDNRGSQAEVADKRKIILGKVCSSFKKEELESIIGFFKKSVNSNNKIQMCIQLEDILEKAGLILK